MTTPNYGERVPLGYEKLTVDTARALNIPIGAAIILIIPEGQPVRWRDDGTNPTAVSGQPLAIGAELTYDSSAMSALRFIGETTGGSINVTYYGL